MYFLKQIRTQFFSQITLYDGMSGPRIQDTASEPVFPAISQKTQPNGVLDDTMLKNLWQHMSAEDLQAFVEEFGKKLEDTKLEEKFVMTQITILINGLRPIAEWKIPGYNINDEGYQAIKKVILELEKIHKHLEQEGVELNMMIQAKLKEVMGDVGQEIWDIKTTEGWEWTEWENTEFSAYISEVSEKNGISETVLMWLLKERYDFKDVTDNEYEDTLAAEFLKNPENFSADIETLIADWKKSDVRIEWEEAFTPENMQKWLEYYARNGSTDPVGNMVESLGIDPKDIFGLDSNSPLSKALKSIFALFWIETTKDMLSSFWGSREAINGMLSQTGKMNELGSLSEFYESGGKWPDAINGDDKGKPSFGTYQLRADSLRDFAQENGISGNHEETFSAWSESEFAKNWKAKVAEIGKEEFQKLEHAFIKKTHFDVLAAKSWFDVSKSSMIVQNVIWSTAVQHGPGTSIIQDAVHNIWNFEPWDKVSEETLIKEIYKLRWEKFPDGKTRYAQEERMALTQLHIIPGSVWEVPVWDIQSVQKEVVYNSDGTVKMTYCARTARLNAQQKFWVIVPQMDDAKTLEESYRDAGNLWDSPTGNVFQIFSGSKRFPNLGHVATGFVRDGQAFVLDPYLPATGTWTHNPIPLQTYISYLNARRWGMHGIANIG